MFCVFDGDWMEFSFLGKNDFVYQRRFILSGIIVEITNIWHLNIHYITLHFGIVSFVLLRYRTTK